VNYYNILVGSSHASVKNDKSTYQFFVKNLNTQKPVLIKCDTRVATLQVTPCPRPDVAKMWMQLHGKYFRCSSFSGRITPHTLTPQERRAPVVINWRPVTTTSGNCEQTPNVSVAKESLSSGWSKKGPEVTFNNKRQTKDDTINFCTPKRKRSENLSAGTSCNQSSKKVIGKTRNEMDIKKLEREPCCRNKFIDVVDEVCSEGKKQDENLESEVSYNEAGQRLYSPPFPSSDEEEEEEDEEIKTLHSTNENEKQKDVDEDAETEGEEEENELLNAQSFAAWKKNVIDCINKM